MSYNLYCLILAYNFWNNSLELRDWNSDGIVSKDWHGDGNIEFQCQFFLISLNTLIQLNIFIFYFIKAFKFKNHKETDTKAEESRITNLLE